MSDFFLYFVLAAREKSRFPTVAICLERTLEDMYHYA